MEISTFRRERAGRREREREDVPPSLPVPGSPVSIPPSNLSPSPLARLIFQLWQPFIKNRFQKALLPSDGIPYKSNGRNAPLFTPTPPPTPSIRYPPDCRQTSTHSICSGNTRTQTPILAFPLTFHHISFVVAVIVAVRGPVVDVEALDGSVVVTRGTILHGGGMGKKKITFRLQQSPRQLLHKREEIFQQLMAGLVISRCTRLEARR